MAWRGKAWAALARFELDDALKHRRRAGAFSWMLACLQTACLAIDCHGGLVVIAVHWGFIEKLKCGRCFSGTRDTVSLGLTRSWWGSSLDVWKIASKLNINNSYMEIRSWTAFKSHHLMPSYLIRFQVRLRLRLEFWKCELPGRAKAEMLSVDTSSWLVLNSRLGIESGG